MKKLGGCFLVLVILLVLGVGGALAWYNKQIDTPVSSSESTVDVTIEVGEAAKEVAVKLQAAGVIKSSDVFYLYLKLNNLGEKIQAGKYQIPQNKTVKEVAKLIQQAQGNDIKITIPEGLRIDEVAEILDTYFLKEESSNFDKDEFIKILENPDEYELDADILKYKPEGNSLEGFLLPETYFVNKDITSWELANFLVNELDKRLKDEDVDLESSDDLTPYEVLTLASLIERESRVSEERYMIADILLKRLRGELDGTKLLGVDAALLYEEKDWNMVVTVQLKEKDSPYNTYKTPGLPPTPICSSRIESIKAVLDPTENDYFYYLHDDQGKIHYAKTQEEQTRNQRCYINENTDYCD